MDKEHCIVKATGRFGRLISPYHILILGCIAVVALFTACSATAQTAPSTPPAQICGSSILTNPNGPPSGATIVPAGDNSNINFGVAGMTYYFQAGTHTIGTGIYASIYPGNNSTFIGAPGAVMDGQSIQSHVFSGTATGVTIQYLTIQHFGAPFQFLNGYWQYGNNNNYVVNSDGSSNWTIRYNKVANNHGIGVDGGTNVVISYNCLDSNGQAGLGAYAPLTGSEIYGPGPAAIDSVTIDHNEISNNDTDDVESKIYGCGCSGGFKLWNTSNVMVTNNWAHDNKNVAMWVDTQNFNTTFTGNYIANNYAEGIIIEISYNVLIQDNTFIGNAIGQGHDAFLGNFPTSAIYISESGGEPRVSSINTPLDISYNNFVDNWGGVTLWESPDRFCDNLPTSDPNYNKPYNLCTKLIAASTGNCSAGTINNAPYYNDCRWHTQNVYVHNNTFTIDPTHFPAGDQNCVPACVVSGVFSNQGSYPSWSPYQAVHAIDDAITFHQNNVWSNNQYTGPWSFKVHDQFDPNTLIGFNAWQAAPYSQDVGSTLNNSYTAPIVYGLSPVYGSPGTSVTISGANFGATQGSSTVTFNGAAATPTSWSNTSIVVAAPAGVTTGSVIVTVGGVSSSNGLTLSTFTATPVITSLSPASGPVGTSVTISGANFGANNGNSYVIFNGTGATPTSWSNTSIVVPVPSGATTGSVVVQVPSSLVRGPIISNGVNFTVGSGSTTPNISSLSPTSGAVGAAVTVNGTNFGSTQGSSTVTFNGTSATPTSWSATSIVVPVPSGATSGNVVVSVGGVASNGVSFSVTSGGGGGGTNFLDNATATLDVAGSIGQWTSWYSTSISQSAAAAQGGTADGLSIAITANGGWGVTANNYPGFAASPGPGAISFWAKNGSGSGSTVSLQVQWKNSSGATIQTDCAPVTCSSGFSPTSSWTQVANNTVTIPAGTTNAYVTLVGAGTSGNVIYTDTFFVGSSNGSSPTPNITNLSTTNAQAGTSITISGMSFGSTQGSSTVTFNGTAATPSSWSDNSIVVPVPAGATSGNVVVAVGGNASNGVGFTVTLTNYLNVATATLDVAGSIGQWQPWYGLASTSPLSQSTAAVHDGTYGLSITTTGPGDYWGIQIANYPGFAASPGPATISFWASAGSGSSSTGATLTVTWYSSTGAQLGTSSVAVSGTLTSAWTQASTNVVAPTGTASAFVQLTGQMSSGSVIYADSFFVGSHN